MSRTIDWKLKTDKLKDKIKEQAKEVQTILSPKDPKQGLTCHNEHVWVYWNKAKKLVALEKKNFKLGYGYLKVNGKKERVERYGKELIGIIPQKANKEEDRLVFEWTSKNIKYKVTVGETVNPYHGKTKGFDCFIKIQNKNKVRYYRTINFYEENEYSKYEFEKTGNKILSFICYEVFAENNFEEVRPSKKTQKVVSQHLYDKGSIFKCPKCGGKKVIRACGMTRLSVYKIPPRELCSCYSTPDFKDLITEEILLKELCKNCEQNFTAKDFQEGNFFPLFTRKDIKWDSKKANSLEDKMFRSFSIMGGMPTKDRLKAILSLNFSHEYCPCWDKDDGND